MLGDDFVIMELHDYADAYSRLEYFCKNNERLLMFGQFGEIKNPSISDLDVFVCYEDKNFLSSRKAVLDYIRADPVLNYLCSHDPVIIPLSLVQYFQDLHTMYGFKLSYSRKYKKNEKLSSEYERLLEIIWATSLIPISVNVIADPCKYGSRFKLLLLKNIHQSIANFSSTSNALDLSGKIRTDFISGDLKAADIDKYFYSALLDLLGAMDEVLNAPENYQIRSKSYKITSLIRLEVSDRSGFELKSQGVSRIKLKEELFKLFEQIFYLDQYQNDQQLSRYIKSSMYSYAICKKTGFPYPFITPFYFSFYRSDFRFIMRKFITRILG